jgi:DNA-binding HxlR family transcriptional regulator
VRALRRDWKQIATGRVRRRLDELAKHGFVERHPTDPNKYRLTDKGRRAIEQR